MTDTPREGVREINYDQSSGLITTELFKGYPSSYVIARWGGGNPKKIALT